MADSIHTRHEFLFTFSDRGLRLITFTRMPSMLTSTTSLSMMTYYTVTPPASTVGLRQTTASSQHTQISSVRFGMLRQALDSVESTWKPVQVLTTTNRLE